MLFRCALLGFFVGTSVVHAIPQSSTPSPVAAAAAPVSTACGDIITLANGTSSWFNASQAWACLSSVPFNAGIASQFIQYYNDTVQFQSTLAYLKDPPAGYQQPAVDILGGLRSIQIRIDSGYYQGEYAFEADLYTLIASANDAHLVIFAGLIDVFTFGSYYSIVSVSSDGKEVPKVYIVDDLHQYDNTTTWQPSAIKTINGEDVTEYLKTFGAQNAIGMLEPNADYNQLMKSPALDIQGIYETFAGTATLYPGDNLTFGLENGTEVPTTWLALYNSPGDTGPLTTGGDFYNFFVTGFYPASYDPDATAPDNSTSDGDDSSQNLTSWNSVSPAYPPNADIYQPDLSLEGSGVLTGYFLQDISTAVLSIPAFQSYGADDSTFSDTVSSFISGAKAAGMTKVLLDLQQNGGGTVDLAFDTFRQFFPTISPFAGSRRRSFDTANALGETITDLFDSDDDDDYLYYYLASNEWAITDRINAATGQNFSSWTEYYGPLTYNGGNFSLIERYNLSSFIFDVEAFGDFIPFGSSVNSISSSYQQPWAAEDIAILTDGQCSSSCNLFLEFMTHEAGVKTVVAGGLPSTGPMQAGSGSRGALEYSSDDLDDDILLAQAVADGTYLPQIPADRNSTYSIDYIGLTLRDQIRPNGTVPLQFQYLAANCRIYFTMANFNNYSRLWHDAAAAIWTDSSLCVTGSTGYAVTANTTTASIPPPGPLSSGLGTQITSGISEPSINFNVEATGGLPDKSGSSRVSSGAVACGAGGSCSNSGKCQAVTTTCSGSKKSTSNLCLPPCNPTVGGVSNNQCSAGYYCDTTGTLNSQKNGPSGAKGPSTGLCRPITPNAQLPCPNPNAGSGGKSGSSKLSAAEKIAQGLSTGANIIHSRSEERRDVRDALLAKTRRVAMSEDRARARGRISAREVSELYSG